jgi:hypothetical protein
VTRNASQAIARALRGLRYGSVEIVVHDGRVTQIERKEKVRVVAGDSRDASDHDSEEETDRVD